jgi:cobalt/nickel transport system ATP-binding protein
MIEVVAARVILPNGRTLLDDLSFRLAAGEKVVLLGANGSGKSTLLKLLNGLIDADSGEVRWQGQPLSRRRLREREFARAFRSRNVLLFQHPEAMLFNASVAEEIAYGPQRLGLADCADRVNRYAAELGLEHLLTTPPFELSGGEKQKLALAALLVLEPDCLLLDEPTAHLDPRAMAWLVDWLLDTPQAALISTHNLSLAKELASRCLVLGPEGRLLFDGSLSAALKDIDLMAAANLAHRHRHRHRYRLAGGEHAHFHSHFHTHDWDATE